jgi:thiol-disulfide isomerase/thioredoxin
VLRALLVIAALQGLAVAVYWQVEQRRSQQAQGSFRFERLSAAPALPALELERADGTRVQPASSRPVLLHFWATWCPPCREELPALLELGRGKSGLDVVALSLDDDWAVVREFFGGAIPPEVVRDPSGALRETYEVGALPDTYLLEPGTRAALRFAGARAWGSPQARAVLEAQVSRR